MGRDGARAPRRHPHARPLVPRPRTQNFADVFPHLIAATDVGALVKIDDVDFSQVDAVFCCLPHATTQQIIKGLPSHLKVVDLSADFRLSDVNSYAEWCAAAGGTSKALRRRTSRAPGPEGSNASARQRPVARAALWTHARAPAQ